MSFADKMIEDSLEKSATVKWDKIKGGGLKGTYNNALNFMTEHCQNIRFNLFSSEIEYGGQRFQENHLIQIKEAMRSIRLEPTVGIIREALVTIALKNEYHPVKNFILSLKWDGQPRLDTWLIDLCGAEDSPYTRFVSRIIFLGIVNRIFRPGCQFDFMPILEGDQGIGKSSIVRTIGGEWYKEVSLLERDRDTIQRMQGAIVVEIAELAAFGKRDIDSLKAFITHPSDFARFAYAMTDNKYPRQSIFIGTVNPDASGYLHDDSGNRRFLPVKVAVANIPALINARGQLFAEAYQMYLKGEKIYISDSEMLGAVVAQQKDREYQDPWVDAIVKWANNQQLEVLENLTCLDIYLRVLDGKKDSCTKMVSVRIGSLLKKLGCTPPKVKKIGGNVSRFWDLQCLVDKKSRGEIGGWEE